MIKALLLLALLSQSPDRTGEVALPTPEYQGTRATAPIPPEQHIRNEGGSDGAGLCVISSAVINGHYQGVGDLTEGKGSKLWQEAKRRPGGYYPEKLKALLDRTMPNEKWASHTGTDPTILDKLNSQGYPIGATMNTGALYNYQPIHHMISLTHYRTGQWACVVDNNDPGRYHWMPANEFAKRWVDGNDGWAFWWLKKPPVAAQSVWAAIVAALLFVVASVKRRLAVPALALSLFMLMPTGAQAQDCRNGRCLPNPSNYVTVDGTYVMYPSVPITNVQPAQPPEWTNGYFEFTSKDGQKWLSARKTSPKFGPGDVYFQPDAWKRKQGETAPEATKAVKNYGVDASHLTTPGQPSGSILTNDPNFKPHEIGLPVGQVTLDTSTPAGASAAITRTLVMPAVVVAVLSAAYWRFGRRPRRALT